MRTRLVHTLSLLLLTAVLLAVLSMGGLMAWNLRNGFSDYLAARDATRVDRFAEFITTKVRQAGGIRAMQDSEISTQELFTEFAILRGLPPDGAPPGADRGLESPSPSNGLRLPHDAPDAGPRGGVFELSGELIWGQPLRSDDGQIIERPVRLNGETVAMVRVPKSIPVPDDIDARFLMSQYGGIAGVALALLVLAVAGAWWIASRWVRPLLAVQVATGRIACGEFNFRLDGSRSDEIGDVMRNINEMAQGLAELEGARRRWIADISHELRTPLTVLRGEVEALVDGVRPLNREAAASLHEEILHVGSLVNDLHLLAMSDIKALSCHFDEVDAAALLQRMFQRFALRAAQLGLTLEFTEQSVEPIWASWDATRIEQVLGNLLDNSLRYTDAPGKVLLHVARSADRIHIEVNDSGPSVPAADLDKLFEPLYRADVARTRHTGGSGLGLAICRAIVQVHQGTIGATTSTLGGLRILIDLPVESSS